MREAEALDVLAARGGAAEVEYLGAWGENGFESELGVKVRLSLKVRLRLRLRSRLLDGRDG